MTNYRISVRACAQLLDIYDFTEAAFGAYQAEAYHAGLERTSAFWRIYRASANLLMS